MKKPTEQRRAEITQSTLELAASHGVSKLTTLAIAQHVGIAHATVFRHFKNREEIFAAALTWIVKNMFDAVTPHFTGKQAADIRLHAVIKTQLDFVSEHRGLPRLLFSDRLHMESEVLKKIITGAMQSYTDHLTELFTAGIEEGVFRQDADAKDASRYLIALFQGLMMRWSVFDFNFQIEKETEPLWNFYFESLRPKHPQITD